MNNESKTLTNCGKMDLNDVKRSENVVKRERALTSNLICSAKPFQLRFKRSRPPAYR